MPVSGPIPYLPSAEQRDRERDADARKFEMRQAAERAAFAAGMSVLEARAAAQKLIASSAAAGEKAVSS